MSITMQSTPQISSLQFAERVRVVASDQPFRWLAAGWNDFRRSRGLSAAYAFGFVVAGLWLTAGLTAAGMDYLILPLAAGFLLVGPAFALGFYAISRDLEAGREPTLRRAFAAWQGNAETLFGMGLAMVMYLAAWLLVAAVLFALAFPDMGFDWQRAMDGMLFTARGQWFLAAGTVVGAVMASVAFVIGAFSLPLMLDRKVGLIEAVGTSAAAVARNPWTMTVWAALVVLFTGVGLATWYVGLCVTLPLIGHATWHAYRAVIRPE
jgi:uncharacterized membrane protein